MNSYIERINELTMRYNDQIRALEDAYDVELHQTPGWNLTSSHLKRQYSKRYDALVREYTGMRRQLSRQYEAAHPEWARWRKLWAWVFVIGMTLAVMCCGAAMPGEEHATSALAQQGQETVAWSAENIPIPYLQDRTQYVSNPDGVLTQGAVDSMNVWLGRLEAELGVQSVWIVVNHIENDDPFRMAQDVGNKYGVGIENRGLVVVVGYEDHSINMSPGRALEADLTDAECHRLEQRYVVPAMRAEMPDSGMVYLAEAVVQTLQAKELPEMSRLTSADDELDSQVARIMGYTVLFFIVWCVVFLRLNRKYQWLGLLGTVPLIGNPFYVEEAVHIGSGGGFGRGGGFSTGGGFGGGSFGGGSFGGGGATSRW